MAHSLWKFIDDRGTFTSDDAHRINTLYFPLCNASGIMSSVSPDLHGDIKTDFNSFLLEPVSRVLLNNLRSSRNFWVYIGPKKIWSAAGVSKEPNRLEDKFQMEAGLLWHKITRRNKKIGLKAEITSFVPAGKEPVEIMRVDITNISSRPVKFIPTAAIPLFARSAHNLHDHRHVTSLLQRVKTTKSGVIITPTLVFDETGHRINLNSYFVCGFDEKYGPAQRVFPTQEGFTGEGFDLEAPEAVFKNLPPPGNVQGKEPMGAFRFRSRILKPKESAHYTLVMGIVNDRAGIPGICAKFNDKTKTAKALLENRSFWQDRTSSIRINTGDRNFDNWVKWVNTQPALRKIFGCSFLPDFDYGKGGKGWRDLWQDCLSLILNDPEEVRPLLMNNFRGVRVDGSNATIIGKDPGEFIADRNNISRVWMDHGVWPLLTTQLYMHQTGDLGILLEETDYFRDHQLSRSGEIDTRWKPEDGKSLKAKNKEVYKGTILEHILIQNLVQFFNVGPHNHIRLEGADWNDGLDMAPEYGESVAFSCMYAQNLMSLSEIIERLPVKEISVLKELGLLLEIITPMDYSDMGAKNKILREYFQSACRQVSGEKISLKKTDLIDDLKKKAGWISAHIRQKEWLPEGFFNGYYNNDKERVEGRVRGVVRMTLTGQVFPVMSAIAGDAQIKQLFASCRKYLKDKKLKGFHLNTDFKDEQLNLGRAFSFIYGDKENGAFFNHMIVMFAYALYKQGFAGEGYEVLDSIYRMALNTKNSKIYPCLPEYFNAEGRGMYSYLTGSASWFMLTLVTQVFGVRGEYGDFLIEPKLSGDQFRNDDTLSISANFAGKDIQVKFINPLKKDFAVYSIKNAVLNGKQIAKNLKTPRLLIPRGTLLASSGAITLEITLA